MISLVAEDVRNAFGRDLPGIEVFRLDEVPDLDVLKSRTGPVPVSRSKCSVASHCVSSYLSIDPPSLPSDEFFGKDTTSVFCLD